MDRDDSGTSPLSQTGRRTRLGTVAQAGVTAASLAITRAIPSTGEHLPVIGMGSWITFDVRADAVARATGGGAAAGVLLPRRCADRFLADRVGHMVENMGAVYGRLTDAATRRRMIDYFADL